MSGTGGKPGVSGMQSWRKNPEILKRVLQVSELTAERLSAVAIAAQLGLNERSVRLDLARARSLYQEATVAEVAEQVADSIRAFQRITQEAWRRLHAIPEGSDPKGAAALLARADSAEQQRAKLLGLIQDSVAVRYQSMSDGDLVALASTLGLIPSPDDLPELEAHVATDGQ